ncbi:MAG: hypothetical protein SF051_05410 [Elusimicrobiota bacterium]|nr:hypothetical protein [Elusimicrobiota bacterium]
MRSIKRSVAAPELVAADQDEVSDLADDVRYLLMRVLRFGGQLLLDAGVVLGLAYAYAIFMGAIVFANQPTPLNFVKVLGCVILAFLCMAMMYGVGVAYRYDTTKPGLDLRRCGDCGIIIRNEWSCSGCESPRLLAKGASCLIWTASAMLTCVWVVHDLLVLWFAFGKRR